MRLKARIDWRSVELKRASVRGCDLELTWSPASSLCEANSRVDKLTGTGTRAIRKQEKRE